MWTSDIVVIRYRALDILGEEKRVPQERGTVLKIFQMHRRDCWPLLFVRRGVILGTLAGQATARSRRSLCTAFV